MNDATPADEEAPEDVDPQGPTPDQEADALMARQYSAINRRQANECGLTRHQIAGRLKSGRWLRRERSVFVAAAAPESSEQRAAVAVLRGPQGTLASHLTAAALWDLCGFPARPHVTVPVTASVRFTDVEGHRSPFDTADISEAQGLPCTSPARTLVDVAAMVGYRRLCDLVDRALFLRLTDADEVRSTIARVSVRPGRLGLGRLAQALEVWTPGPHPGSEAEMRLLRQLQEWGLPLPKRQLAINDLDGLFVARADLGCSELKLIYEYEGEEFHGPRQRGLDAARRRRVEALGWTIIRVTKKDLRNGGARLRRRLLKVCALRPFLAA